MSTALQTPAHAASAAMRSFAAQWQARPRDPQRAVIIVTHYQRLLDYIVPDHVHVLSGGRILKSGDRSLAQELERRGYDWVLGAEVA